jgi:hypothetical protein
MKIRLITTIVLFGALLSGSGYKLSPRYRTVYIVPMAHALNEHLASHITSDRLMWVVLEPANADTVLTDTLDENFWTWLGRNYPAPTANGNSAANHGTAFRGAESASLKRDGTVFLVDPRSRLVMWSTYSLPKNTSPDELDRTAVRIAKVLKSAFGK